jgi:hypothetical protein
MRTTKRFTPKVIARFEREGRGTGTYAEYRPWHDVSRGDPASSGRSHLLMWRKRLRALLSDGELTAQLFVSMMRYLDDCLEQFKLSLDPCFHLLDEYERRTNPPLYPGTIELAKKLGIKHPKITSDDTTELWRASTDLVPVFKPPVGPRHVIAFAFKPDDCQLTPRKKELLALEREYWLCRGVPWLLITPSLYEKAVMLTLRRIMCWSLSEEVSPHLRRIATATALECSFESLTTILQRIQRQIGCIELAKLALWQAVWYGELPVDLRRGWRPHLPLVLLSQANFLALNPVASGRSAWI